MILQGGFDTLFYPMTADLYYSTQTQSDLGEIIRTWTRSKTIKCSAIKQRATYNATTNISDSKFFDYNQKINLRSPVDILGGYPVTEVLITNIRDQQGTMVWVEPTGDATCFEVESIEPMLDENNNLAGYRSLLIRSNHQGLDAI